MTSEQIFDHVRTTVLALVVSVVFVLALVQMPALAVAMLLGFVVGCLAGAGYVLWLIRNTPPSRDKGRLS